MVHNDIDTICCVEFISEKPIDVEDSDEKMAMMRKRFTNLIFPHEVREARYFIGESSNHVDRCGEEIVELLRLFCLRNRWITRTQLSILRVIYCCLVGRSVQMCPHQCRD